MEEDWIKEVEENGLTIGGRQFHRNLKRLLKGEPQEGLCRYSKKFEEQGRLRRK